MTRIKAKGRRTIEWEEFRNAAFEAEKDDDGIIMCEDYKIGLPRCGIGLPSMDLHHILGRDGELLTDRTKMVWLTRDCHKLEHSRVQYEDA